MRLRNGLAAGIWIREVNALGELVRLAPRVFVTLEDVQPNGESGFVVIHRPGEEDERVHFHRDELELRLVVGMPITLTANPEAHGTVVEVADDGQSGFVEIDCERLFFHIDELEFDG